MPLGNWLHQPKKKKTRYGSLKKNSTVCSVVKSLLVVVYMDELFVFFHYLFITAPLKEYVYELKRAPPPPFFLFFFYIRHMIC